MGVMLGSYKKGYPVWTRAGEKSQTKKKEQGYMEQLTQRFLENFRAYVEAGK